MRPGYMTFFDTRGSGVRHFPADTHLIDWLTVKGFAFDVITDHDLDREGAALLRPYRAVVTGSHPEYHTANTLDALQEYIGGGGRRAYLGGASVCPAVPRDRERSSVPAPRRSDNS
jgi:N,N-dimethylformamidase